MTYSVQPDLGLQENPLIQQTQTTQYQDVTFEYGTGGEYELPDPGNYKIVFKGVVESREWPSEDKDGNPRYDDEGNPLTDTSLTLQFAIDDEEDDFDGTEFRDYFPLKITPGNKSGRLWAAFLGISVEELMANPIPKTSAIVGRRCDASLIHRKATNGKAYLKIGAATPLKKRRERPAPAAPVDVEEMGEPDF
jgi:hypothetical protein